MQTEETKEIEQFQWKKGDNFGKVVTVESTDSEFLYFTDGSKIFKNVAPEFLEKVVNGELPFPGADEVNLTVTKAPVKKEAITPAVTPQTEELPKKEQDSPLTQLIKNLSSKNVESFNMNVGINLPKKEIFNMLVENSEQNHDEILQEISQVAASQIEIDNLQEFLKEQIQNFVNNYYKI